LASPRPHCLEKYIPLKVDLGVSSLYYAPPIDSTHELLETENYRLILEIWQQHRVRLAVGHAVRHTGQGIGHAVR